MFKKTYYSTHPAMMDGASGDDLRERYLVPDLFVPGELVLTYSHDERFIIGGAVPTGAPLTLPTQAEPPSAAGHPLLERRELGVVNIGTAAGEVVVDGEPLPLARYEVLYVPRGSSDVVFTGDGARFFLLSVPAHAFFPLRKLTLDDGNTLHKGSLETANDRTIHQLLVPEVCETASLCLGMTRLKPGSVWNTMPPHLHDRRSEIYLYFDLEGDNRVFHFMGQPDALRQLVVANEEVVISPPWSVHMGAGTSNYAFIWAMAGENLDYGDMDVCDMGQLR